LSDAVSGYRCPQAPTWRLDVERTMNVRLEGRGDVTMTARYPRVRAVPVSVAILLGATAAALALAIAGAQAAASGPVPGGASPLVSQKAVAFHDAMRKLWEDHITWTRNVIISFEVNDPDPTALLPDLSAALNRLFQNQGDIGDAIKPYYGDEAGQELTDLLHEHIALAGAILEDVKTGDSAKYQTDNALWYANAHDIAVFLSGGTVQGSTVTLNPPTGSLADWDQMMKDHLDATTAEVVARLKSDWTGDVAAYDTVHTQALGMADMLSSGIIAQFPHMFLPTP
jgi:hypothetical protein